ncbi:MAG: glutamine--fructose-6-phosphate transaminase (isomerizing) [Saprospiraceae bacterium]|uniref:Glutamine--fructose-6-phosphate aminotransferase [isomerizing] n=1 Tax=Candidatus Opimibacter skivensis TaxID=2982028 RepID=A0A9D7T290_9BACT|nr:glutamine--fructose-6-phosphate transaminase (isomerizing) [Candidatus Opimibacter skivensis]
MCGIVGYIGHRPAYQVLMQGLKQLEYRGYDSAGVALLNSTMTLFKKKGKVSQLEDFIGDQKLTATAGMGHTRWATHGEPNDINAHPHVSNNGNLVMIHNGIIENYSVLKEALLRNGFTFKSETDTEVFLNLIEAFQDKENLDLPEALSLALDKVVGAYAIVIADKRNPDVLVAARKQSPLVVGMGENEYFIGSDATPIVRYTNKVIYMKDDEIAILDRHNGVTIKNSKNQVQKPRIEEISLKIEELEKGGYEHFMLKEIHQQPQTVSDCMRGRLNDVEGWVKLGGMEEYAVQFENAQRIIIAGCGTSWHAGLIGEYLFEDLARVPVEVEYASELRYRNPVIREGDIVMAISQSGETADTLAALEHVKSKGAIIYGVVNAVGSSIARLTDAGSYIHSGPEIGVASTKAFTGQVTLLSMAALWLGHRKGTLSHSRYRNLISELAKIPEQIAETLKVEDQIKYIASEMTDYNNSLYLGRGYNFPVALEGALKLKEISYIHAEGYPAAEMKHGPIALIDEHMPVVVLATNQSAYDKLLSNIMEVKARKGTVIAIVSNGAKEIRKFADHVIEIPTTAEPFSPLLSVIPTQLLSYHIARLRGCNVDQPRNLAKSVTVE